jgi:hypothetical protein
MNTQPLPSPKPADPCPSCGCAAPLRPSYAPPGVWYCGNWRCGAEYPRTAGVVARPASAGRSGIRQGPASEDWP